MKNSEIPRRMVKCIALQINFNFLINPIFNCCELLVTKTGDKLSFVKKVVRD